MNAYELGKKVASDLSDDKGQLGICLMAYPDDASLKKIQEFKKTIDSKDMSPIPNDGTDGPHITIRYWKSKEPASDEVKQYIKDFVKKNPSVEVTADAWKIMGDGTLAMAVTSPELMKLQKEIDKGLQERGVPPSDYPDFIPHISMFEDAKSTPSEKPDLKLTFKQWLLSTRTKELMDKEAARRRDFARGLPDPKSFGSLKKLPLTALIDYVLQEHRARRAGRHLDLRFGGTGQKGPLYSWAVPSGEMPTPGGRKLLAVRQPLHKGQYANFEGEIVEGYGAGTVKTQDKGRVVITKAQPGKINFTIAHKKFPENYTLVKMKGTGERNWLLMNTTPQDIIPHKKVHYTKVDQTDVAKLFDKKYLHSEKIDGAAALMKLFHDKIEILSYRPSKKGVPIVHSMRVGGTTDLKIPKHLVGSILRGELYGVRKGTDEAIPPQQLGGILNATLANSIEKQKAEGVELRAAIFNILQRGKEPVSEETKYPERLDMLKEVMQSLPANKFHMPRMETDPAKQKQMWEQISKGLNPRTREGIVAWPLGGGKPTKVKLTDESDVYVRDIVPGERGIKGRAAGGFRYSVTPRGPVVGKVGTGFDAPVRVDMLKNPQDWIGRVARIKAQEQFSSGAYRAPAFLALHEDYPASKVAHELGCQLALKTST